MMAKDKKPAPMADAPAGELAKTVTEIRERFRKLVRGSYFPQRKVVEFVAYLDGLIPKVKADNATSKPTEPERTATAAGTPL
jgi:hypothetical protein